MKYISALAVILAILVVADISYAEAQAKEELKDITLTGTITKVEKKIGEKTTVTYVLTEKDGSKVNLPQPEAAVGEKVINLDDYVGVEVNLVGQGTEKELAGKKKVTISKIVSIEKAPVKVEAPAEVEAPAVKE